MTITTDASLTASITQTGPAFFRIVNISLSNLALEALQASQLPPALKGMAGQLVWQQEPVATSDGVTPIAVNAGQWIALNVVLDVPDGTMPGAVTASATLSGGAGFTRTIPLSAVYLGVNVNSPIGKKWAAMGGEAKLGAVKANEQAAPDGKGTYQQFANGVLYAYQERVRQDIHLVTVVYFLSTAVWTKWLSLSAAKDAFGTAVWSVIGYPTADTAATAEGGQAQVFQHGEIVVRAAGQAWVVYGAILATYLQFGDPANSATKPSQGYPTSDEEAAGGTASAPWRVSHFDFVDVYWSSATGAHEVHDVIRAHWLANAYLGYPITDQTVTADAKRSFNTFQNGVIYQNPAGGVFEVHGSILGRWSTLGFEHSYLGYPVSDEGPWTAPAPLGPGRISSFQYGQIAWRQSDGAIFEIPAVLPPWSKPVLTPDGSALGGTVSVTLKSNGDFVFECHMHDSGIPSYDFTVRAIFTTPAGLAIAAQHTGHVEGTDATTLTHAPNRDDDYTETDNNRLIQSHWASGDIQAGTLWITKDYSATGVVGFVQDLTKFILDAGVGTAAAAIGVVISMGREIGQIFGNLGVGMVAGVFAGVAVCVFPGGFLVALVAGVAVGGVTDALIQQRQISQAEYNFADAVFQGSLPAANNIILTNLSGLNGTAFTFPGVDANTYVNLGDGYNDPPNYTNTAYPAKGELLIHELTHAWQIKHQDFTAGLICNGIVNQADKQIAGHDVYQYGPPSDSWGSFNMEAQGAIVDQWFGGVRVVNAPNRTLNWNDTSGGKAADPKALSDPYFAFIANNIRKGQT